MRKCLSVVLLAAGISYFAATTCTAGSARVDDSSLILEVSRISLRKSLVYLPLSWNATMAAFSVGYETRLARFGVKIGFGYGRSASISVNGFRKEGSNWFSLTNVFLGVTWHNANARAGQRFLYGFGACFESVELRQRVSLSPGKYNLHEDKYVGIGPCFSGLWGTREGPFVAGFDLAMPCTLPYASHGITRTNGSYSDKSYIWWIKLKIDAFIRYRLSEVHSVELAVERDTWIYGRNPYRNTRKGSFYSGGAFLLNSVALRTRHSF